MNVRDAVALISPAIADGGGTWADVGAGDGTFSRALVELLGPESRVYAVDCDERALASINAWPSATRQQVVSVVADFTRPFDWPGVGDALLDGLLFANSLHFVRDAGGVLARLTARVKPGGRVVFVEYDRRAANQWVPYPISSAALPALAASAGLSTPTVVAVRPSTYGGDLYVAAANRIARDSL